MWAHTWDTQLNAGIPDVNQSDPDLMNYDVDLEVIPARTAVCRASQGNTEPVNDEWHLGGLGEFKKLNNLARQRGNTTQRRFIVGPASATLAQQ